MSCDTCDALFSFSFFLCVTLGCHAMHALDFPLDLLVCEKFFCTKIFLFFLLFFKFFPFFFFFLFFLSCLASFS